MRKVLCIALAALLLSACGSTKSEDESNVRWPDFLRDWAADYEINDEQRLSLMDLVDSVYCFFEDSTLSADDYSDQICRMLARIAGVIANDSVFEFTLMMRATAANFWGYAVKDNRFFQCDCSGESLGRIVEWQTVSTDDVELMCYTIMPISWRTPWHFANVLLTIGKDDKEPYASLVVTNYEDYHMDSIRVAFIDKHNIILDILYEEDVWVDSTNAKDGIKTLLIPYDYLMQALSHCMSVVVTYQTPQELFTMRGVPAAGFDVQINDCPRLKSALEKTIAKGNPFSTVTDEIINGIGQPIKRVENKTTGEVFDFDGDESTWYLDTAWSEDFGAYYLHYTKKKMNPTTPKNSPLVKTM